MKTTVKLLLFYTLCCVTTYASKSAFAHSEVSNPLTSDVRIKTYVYNPNDVFLILVHFGFQSHIQFDKGEEVRTIYVGDSYSWKITPLGNMLFLKSLEGNATTNMTIITNKRTYNFDLTSRYLEPGNEADLMYVVKFLYPQKKNYAAKRT
jgi:type IV secretion system protein VirB9